jgi:outer membrane immunogenic protein
MSRKAVLIGAIVTVVGMSGAALAADLPTVKGPPTYAAPPVFTWTGPYIGAQIGYQWGSTPEYLSTGGVPSYTSGGVAGGVHFGYNNQYGPIVAGAEGEFEGATYNGSTTNAGVGYGANERYEGSIRGRVGYAFDRVWFYGTGGVAFGKFNNYDNSGGFETVGSLAIGWTAGAGLEYAIDNNWSLRAEYRYTEFGQYTFSPPNISPTTATVRPNENSVRLGVTYKFDVAGPVLAKY